MARVKYTGYKYVSGLTYEGPEIGDTWLGPVNLDELQKKFNKPNPPPIIERVVGSGLIEAAAFSIPVQCPKLVLECIKHYNSQTQEVRIKDNRLVLKIQRSTFVSYLRTPEID